MAAPLTALQQKELQEDVAVLLGYGPGGKLNYAYADNYFGHYLKERYGEAALSEEIERQKKEHGDG